MGLDYSKLSDDALQQMAEGKVDYSKLSDSDLAVISGKGLPSKSEAAYRGGKQGLSMGFSDEVAGLIKNPKGALRKAWGYVGEYPDINDQDVLQYEGERDESRNLDKAAREAHPKIYGGSELACGIATSFVPGLGIAKGAKTAQGLMQASKLGLMSGVGASEGSTKEDLAFDSAVSGVGGMAGQGVGNVVGKTGGLIASKVATPMANKLSNFAEKRAVKQAGAMLADERGLKYQNRLNKTGRMLLDKGIVGPFTSVSKIKERVAPIIETAGKKIGQVAKDMDEYISLIRGSNVPIDVPDTSKMAVEIRKNVIAPLVGDPALGGMVPQLEKIVERLESKNGASFTDLAKMKLNFDKLLEYDKLQSLPKEEIKQIRSVLSNHMDDFVDRLQKGRKGSKNDIFSEWKAAKEEYGILKKVSEMADDKMSRNEANRWLTPTDYIALGLGGGYAASGDNENVLGGGLIGLALNRGGKAYGNAMASTGANALSKGLKTKLPKALTDIMSRGAAVTGAQTRKP